MARNPNEAAEAINGVINDRDNNGGLVNDDDQRIINDADGNERAINDDGILRIIQLNMQGSRLVSDEARVQLDNEDVDILLAQEPYSAHGRITGFGLATRVINGTTADVEKVQAAIVVRNREVTVLKISQLCNAHCSCVQINTRKGAVYLVSMYFQFSHEIEPYLQHLGEVIRQLRGKKVIIGCDANAKSPVWGSRTLDERGRKLEDFIAENNLVILNKENELSTFSNIHGESNIDVTLATESAAGLIRRWTVRGDWTMSDHRAIDIVIAWGRDANPAMPVDGEAPKRFAVGRANWENYMHALPDAKNRYIVQHEEIAGPEHVYALADGIEQTIISACSVSMPLKRRFPRSVPWWNDELTALKGEVYRRRREFQHEHGASRRAKQRVYREARITYKKAIGRAKVASWQSFVNESNSDTWGLVYKLQTERLRVDQALGSLVSQQVSTTDWLETADVLLRGLMPDDTEHAETEAQRRVRDEILTRYDAAPAPSFEPEEVRKAIRDLANGKAPGPDRIEVEALKASWPVLGADIVRLFNACLNFGVFPKRWKLGLVKALLKGPGKDESKVKSYRPICLLSVVGKSLERLIARRLTPIFHGELFCSDRQYGFRPGRSTEDAIVKFRDLTSNRREKYVLALLFDIAGAFDNVWWPNVLLKLRNRDCPCNLYALVEDYFREREVTLSGVHGSRSKVITKGCPQGSILGPYFWNLIFDEVLHRLAAGACEPIAYADDLIVLVYGNSRNEIQAKGQWVTDTIVAWCSEIKLELSASKTEMLLVKGTLDIRRPPIIKIGGQTLKLKPSVKYLGVHFGTRLNIKPHVEYLSVKCKRMFDNLSHVARNTWGLGHRVMHAYYRGVFVPVVTYAAAGWWDLTNAVTIRSLISVQRYVLLRVTKAYRTISRDALVVIAGVMPVDLAIEESTYRYKIRRRQAFTAGDFNFRPEDLDEERLTVTQARKHVRRIMLDRWQERWNLSDKGRITYAFFTSVHERMEASWIRLDHYVMQFLSGHGAFGSKLESMGLVEDGACDCGEPETALHVLYECPVVEEERERLARSLHERGLVWPLAERELVSKDAFAAFAKFADDVRRGVY